MSAVLTAELPFDERTEKTSNQTFTSQGPSQLRRSVHERFARDVATFRWPVGSRSPNSSEKLDVPKSIESRWGFEPVLVTGVGVSPGVRYALILELPDPQMVRDAPLLAGGAA